MVVNLLLIFVATSLPVILYNFVEKINNEVAFISEWIGVSVISSTIMTYIVMLCYQNLGFLFYRTTLYSFISPLPGTFSIHDKGIPHFRWIPYNLWGTALIHMCCPVTPIPAALPSWHLSPHRPSPHWVLHKMGIWQRMRQILHFLLVGAFKIKEYKSK